MLHDVAHQRRIHLGVPVHEDVPEPRHGAQGEHLRLADPPGAREQGIQIAVRGGLTEALVAHDVRRDVERRGHAEAGFRRPVASVFMCRNITELRGLEPPATREEIEAAAWQFVRKVTGVTKPTGEVEHDMRDVAHEIAHLTEHLLERLPARRQPPKTLPPLRRPEVRARMGLEPFPAHS